MSIHKLNVPSPRPLLAVLSAAVLFVLPLLLPATTAAASPEDIQEINRLELEGQKVDAFLRLKELAETGDPWAQWKLAGYYHYGYAGPANFPLALDWYQRAARQGNVDAMLGIAIMLDPANNHIKSIPKDRGQAFTWLSIAATQLKDPTEIATVQGLRDKLKSEMSTAELNAALNAAMSFQPVPEKQP